MSVPLILTILAGAATFIGAFLGVLGQKPSNRLLAFSLGFAAGIMLLISLMEMLPAALAAEGMSPVLGYGMFIFGLLGYFGLDRMLPHAHPQDLMQKSVQPLPKSIKRTAILLTLGISLHLKRYCRAFRQDRDALLEARNKYLNSTREETAEKVE